MGLFAEPAVDWGALLEVVYTSLLAGIGVTAAFALSILGTTRAVDVRRDGNGAATVAYVALALLGFTVVVLAVVFGIVVMTQK